MTLTEAQAAQSAAPNLQSPVAVDFEVFYDSEYCVSKMGLCAFMRDARFDAYLVSIVGDGVRYVGHPKSAPWLEIAGRPWLSHNKGFDAAVYDRLVTLGVTPDVLPPEWHCTANLCTYLGAGRSLAKAVYNFYGVTLSKDIRDREIKGLHWHEFGEDLQRRVLEYADQDSVWCKRLWDDHAEKWPQTEREISELTYEQGKRGIQVDAEGVENDLRILERVKFEALQRIPWKDTDAPLSPRAIARHCGENKIPVPKTLDEKDPRCEEWEDQWGDRCPWVGAMRDYRRANTLIERYKAIQLRIQPNGRMEYALFYGGAHTLRWSGAGGFNMQNMPRSPYYFDRQWQFIRDSRRLREIAKALKTGQPIPEYVGAMVDMRGKFIAAPGKKFIVADYRQIEARVTPWLARDFDTLRLIEEAEARGEEASVYEIHARTSMGWSGGSMKEEDPDQYQLAKARVLGLGFQCGWAKFHQFAKAMLNDDALFARIFGSPVEQKAVADFHDYMRYILTIRTPDEEGKIVEKDEKWRAWFCEWMSLDEFTQRVWVNSWLQVKDFREKNPKIVALWKTLQEAIKRAVGETYMIELPSGRKLRYFNVGYHENGSLQARVEMGGYFKFFHGGVLTENVVQATARDVFAEALCRVRRAGLHIVMHTHDEIVIEVDEDFDGAELARLMKIRPKWAQTLPIDVEWKEMREYTK